MASNTQTSSEQVKQLGLFAAISSLSYVFWIVGGMEMVERLAYYGVKAVVGLYAKDPVSKGGLGITMSQYGNLLLIWTLIQSVLPVFTGGISDRMGYKQTIAVSTVIKILGYLVMFQFASYGGFMAGAVLLATGTAVFKPGIQGTLVKATKPENSSVAWGIFYQTVNIGGFMGPLLAGFMRKMDWKWVFLACAVVISVNFLFLFMYKEPGKEEREAKLAAQKESGEQDNLLVDSLKELAKPHLWSFLLLLSGFWFMFSALFDVLPVYIDEWVWTGDILTTLFGEGGSDNPVVNFFIVTNQYGTQIQPEGLLNVNALLIMLTAFFFGWASGLVRPTTSMALGALMASLSMFLVGQSTMGWICFGSIAFFSVGEMLSSPKTGEFIGNIAPSDKKAMYLGFSQIPLALGGALEGKVGPELYGMLASKELFSRELMLEEGLAQAAVDAIPEGEAFDTLVLSRIDEMALTDLPGMTPDAAQALSAQGIGVWDLHDAVPKDLAAALPEETAAPLLEQAGPHLETIYNTVANPLTQELYASHNVSLFWDIMGIVGVVSAVLIVAYGRWIRGRDLS
ncbi:MAG: MFS transporter [Myxococcota bacterium]|nr:MFS transporter [Myxococcota bacterium]